MASLDRTSAPGMPYVRTALCVLQFLLPLIALVVLAYRANELARPLGFEDEPEVTWVLGISALSYVFLAVYALQVSWRQSLVVLLAMMAYMPLVGVLQDMYLVNLASVVKSFGGVVDYAFDVWIKLVVFYLVAILLRALCRSWLSWRERRRFRAESD